MTDVLIAGAGPTGLFLALLLSKLKVRIRIIDKALEPGTTSRALAVQARTLEFYRQIDLADEVVKRGLKMHAVNLWRRGERAGHIELSGIGAGLTPFPFVLIFPQDEHERLLIERLVLHGVRVERGIELLAVEQGIGGVIAHTSVGPIEAKVLAGCDGARSRVREAIGAGFSGGTYDHVFYVADIEAIGAVMNKELHVLLDDANFLALFPLGGEHRARLIGTVREGADNEPGWEDIDRRPIERIGLDVRKVNWFSTYHVHHRVADRFRRGLAFLLGDAAHIHSPVGGQGMNTGLGDSMNLAWKLAAVLGGRAAGDLLDTYQSERIGFARRLVATTDRVFQAVSSESRFAEVMRTQIFPRVVSRLSRTQLGKRMVFRAVSQTGIEYRDSAWSAKGGGDRLPWVEALDNFKPLRSLDWQLHTYGKPPATPNTRIPLHVFPPAVEQGLREGVLYLVRPDGYIAGAFEDSSELTSYLDRHAIKT
jgi:2-polyprenyl-6-methoxyphenol hydroxylase-like FAD-dependent oxidoreductase